MKGGTAPRTKVYILFENVLQYAGDETMAGVFATFESAVRKAGVGLAWKEERPGYWHTPDYPRYEITEHEVEP